MTADACVPRPDVSPGAPSDWPAGWLRPDLGADLAGRVTGLMSGRCGGFSLPPYDGCNLGDHVQDDPGAVARNRALFAQHLGATPVWLTQVHGNRVVRLSRQPAGTSAAWTHVHPDAADGQGAWQPQADGAVTTEPGLACVVMVADCLPVLLAAPEGRGVAALHAGWRGLAGAGQMQGQGIVHTGVRALCELTGADPGDLRAWLGPCIGPAQFEVGGDVLKGFGVDPADAAGHPRFHPQSHSHPGATQALPSVAAAAAPIPPSPKWLADLPGLARDTLGSLGVGQVAGGHWCTVNDRSRFFSFRRDGVTGRQAAAIVLR